MKQRIKLAQALVHDPDLLFLDEPTNGMDPKGREEMLELIRDLAHNKGVDLILSSHLLPDVELHLRSRDRARQGRDRDLRSIEALKGPRRAIYEVRQGASSRRFSRRSRTPASNPRDRRGRHARVCRARRRAGRRPAPHLWIALKSQAQVRHLRPSIPTLEDVFARAVGEQ
jgi:ABC-2 type transport system ATP-binding protein